jgi:hypothetical protein
MEMEALSQQEQQWLSRLKQQKGVTMLKYGRQGLPRSRQFHLSEDEQLLAWNSARKAKHKSVVELSAVTRITPGQTTKQFSRFGRKGKHADRSARSLSIVYHEGLSSLNLVCNEKEDSLSLLSLLEKLVARTRMQALVDAEEVYFRREWRLADKDNSGTLDAAEVVNVIQRLNISLDKRYIMAKIREVDDNADGVLQFDEFKMLMGLLRVRQELEEMWLSMLRGDFSLEGGLLPKPSAEREAALTHRLPAASFHRLLSQVQIEQFTLEEVVALIKTIDPDSGDGQTLGYRRFCMYMSSPMNEAFDPEKDNVYQDMSQPLSHYWIASSHNTYLEGDQLRSNSSVNRYIHDLCKGCRCVELDCWDGEEGDPIIFHGMTLTGKIKFWEVIAAIKQYAFNKSDFPVILSLENHCSLPQQERMADYLKSILGEHLVVPPLDENGALPSPQSLRRKIVLKGKVLPASPSSDEVPLAEEEEDDEEEEDEEEDEEAGTLSSRNGAQKKKKQKKKAKKLKIAPELSALTFLAGSKFKGWEEAARRPAYTMSSFGEVKTEKLLKKSSADWVEYNKRQISRIYPAGKRVDSSNYNPVPSWNVGSQIVALNYQTAGESMWLNDGKFRDNGGCGYLLKPSFLREGSSSLPPMTLKVTVISAQQLPKPGGAHKGEIIDPYVRVKVIGAPTDTTPPPLHTRVVGDNGFKPIWNMTIDLKKIEQPELALLSFTVMDKDVDTDDFIAASCLPVRAIRPGFRSVALFSSSSTRHGAFENCSLFCRFEIG